MAVEPIVSLDTRITQLETELLQIRKAHGSLVRKVRASGAGVLAISCICLLSNSLPTALAQGYGTTLRSILQRITALETAQKATTANLTSLNNSVASLDTKTKYLTTGVDRNGYPASYFTACNVYIQDGLGSTSGMPTDPIDFGMFGYGPLPRTNGLGNLIIGYNEPQAFHAPGGTVTGQYTGSHNLIVGAGNQYSSFGAIVGGAVNYSDAPYGSILDGYQDECSGSVSTITAGVYNLATGVLSSVGGGYNNSASGVNSTVSGGEGVLETYFDSWAGGSYHTP